MLRHESVPTALEAAPYLQPPPGRSYVRSFLFTRRVDAPLARIHLLARALLVVCLSAAQLRTMSTAHPDLVGAIVLWIPSVLLFIYSGIHAKIARLYIALIIPTLLSLFLTWTLLNPVPGSIVYVQHQVYSGFITLGLAAWQPLWLAIVIGYYWWKRAIVNGILLASIAALLVSLLLPLPAMTLTRVAFFHPLTLMISNQGLLLAITKDISYSGMMIATLAVVITCRDIELMGALRQLHLPQPVIFFLSTVFRALNLALSDYETIYQAQIARAVNAQPRSFYRRLRDLASIAVPMVAMMIRRSSEIGDALLARGYNLRQKSEDFYETSPWRAIDWGVLVICLILLYLAVGPYPGLTALFQRWW